MDSSTVSRWDRFRGRCVRIENDPRPGSPSTSTDERNVKLVADALEEDSRETCEKLSRATGIPPASVFHILTNDLRKRKTSARRVSHYLTAEHKQKRLDIATLLKERFNVQDRTFFRRIVVIDETLIKDFEPVLISGSKISASSIKGQANDLCL